MLQNTKALYGTKLAALDGDIGRVKDFYFDDKTWAIRYVVADTGNWLTGRLVLLSPHAFASLHAEGGELPVRLHKKQIEASPSIESHRPVSRQFEIEYHQYYGWPAYWNDGATCGLGGYPVIIPPALEKSDEKHPHHREDKHLQSAQAVSGYHIQASDGMLGEVTGFLVDEKSWAIRDLVVGTGHWYAGKEVLIPAAKIDRISYELSTVFVRLTKADLRHTADHAVARSAAGSHELDKFTD